MKQLKKENPTKWISSCLDMPNPWYEKYKKGKETEEFNIWWIEFYGKPEDYQDPDEYWVRKGFALDGWLAAGNPESADTDELNSFRDTANGG